MKNTFTALLLFIHAAAFSQSNSPESTLLADSTDSAKVKIYRDKYPNACYIYKTAEDYYSNNPIPNMEWHVWNSGSKIEIVRNGKTERLKVSELATLQEGYTWFSDQNGLLVRNFQNTLYRVVVDGPVCYYVELFNGEVKKVTDSTFAFFPSQASGKYFEYYSMTLKGDLKNGFDKVLEKYLREYGLMEQYKAERVVRNVEDGVWDVESRKINKKLKYLRIVNAKRASK